MRTDTSSTPTYTPIPPPRPARPDRPLRQRQAPGTEAAAVATTRYVPEHPAVDPRTRREARTLSVSAFAVAATALLMPFTALVSLALATVAHAKGDEALGRAAFFAALAAMAAGFVLNLTVIDVTF